ncbi:Hypothetical_protein [Hexamita inflata]|uniref:Hypothetical_protein n=1 Tax=Hexamita inflata TaxID=28002 RepID=A0AA86NCN5_9EUKA|nr:Hypothetical protein HINF_LOCUS4249 [Hexamita inflata]
MKIQRMQNTVVNHPLKYKKQIPLSNLIQYSTTKLNSTRAFAQIYYTSKKLSIKIILSQILARRRQPGGVTVGCSESAAFGLALEWIIKINTQKHFKINFHKNSYLILSTDISQFITFDHRVLRDKIISFPRLNRLSRNTNRLVFTNFSRLRQSQQHTIF